MPIYHVQKQLPAPFVVYADFKANPKPEKEDVDVIQRVDIGIVFISLFPRTHPV